MAGSEDRDGVEASRKAWMRRVGRRIQLVRKRACPNAAEFARLLRVDPSTVKKIESGDRQPSAEIVFEISNRLGISTDYILKGDWRTLDDSILDLLDDVSDELKALRERPDKASGN